VDPPPPFADPPPVLVQRAVPPLERLAAAVEVLLCSGFPTQLAILVVMTAFGMKPVTDGRLSAPFVFTLTLVDTVLLLGLMFMFLLAHRESPAALFLGVRRPSREALVGVLLIPVSFLVIVAVLAVVQAFAPGLRNVPHNPLQDLMRTRVDAVVFALVVMIAGGVREELQRAFVLHRFEQALGGAAVGLVLFSAVFGLGHIEQGFDVAIATAALGCFWGVVFLRRRSSVAPMVCHAGFNLLQIGKFLIVSRWAQF
jgi:membrane protease YdiL (CAAX protease family)